MNRALIIVATLAFLLGLGLIVLADAPDPEVLQGLLYGGLAAFAASFLPWERQP